LSLCCALTGLKYWLIFTQGVALGWYVAALSGLRKKMYTLVDLSAREIKQLAYEAVLPKGHESTFTS